MDINKLIENSAIRDFFQITDKKVNLETMELLKLLEECNYDDGQDVVVYGGGAEDGMYIILDGTADVLSKDGKLINTLKSGAFVGELALISGKTRMATIRAKEKLTAVRISRNMFYDMMNKNPRGYATFMESIYSSVTKAITEQQKIKAELNVAKQIQASALVRNFDNFGLEVYATMEPAKEVGGDFYDVIKIDDTHVGLLIADVSGKGISAALFMLMAKTTIKNMAQMRMKPSELLEKANNALCETNDANMFVTTFFGILNIETGEFVYANAGHNPPIIYHESKYEWLEVMPSFVLAGMENMKYKDSTVRLHGDDMIILYTDGVTEAQNIQEELFSEERLINYLNGAEKFGTVKEVLQFIRKGISGFVGEADQFDDITMLGFKLK